MPQNHADTSLRETILIRPMKDSDFNYVINSWLKTYKYSGPSVRRMRDQDYYPAYEPIVKRLIQSSDVYIASLREEPDVIAGYLSIERHTNHDIIHFLLIKDLWQKMGIARYLIQASDPKHTTYFTHWTSPIESLIHKIPFHYQPFLITKQE